MRPAPRFPLVPALVVAAALAVRLLPWAEVYGGERVRLTGDSDAHYHVLRAERLLIHAPGAPWRDPTMNWPYGADVPWPPGFDALVAGIARVRAGPIVEREAIAAAAAPLPALLGVGMVLLVAALGRRLLGPGRGWVAALLVALLPVASELTVLGRVDQHAAELVLFCAFFLVFVRALRAGPRAPAWGVALAAFCAAAFWIWMGSAFHLVVPLLAAAAWYVVAPRGDAAARSGLAALAVGGLGGAAVLALTIAVLGAPGALADGRTTGVGALHVALVAAAGAFAALVLALSRPPRDAADPGVRASQVVLAASVPAIALLLVPPLRRGIAGGLVALAAGNPWYAMIEEFTPVVKLGEAALLDAFAPAWAGYGLAHVAAAAGALALARAWRREPARRPELIALGVAFVGIVPLALARRRFGAYAAVPLALVAEAGLRAAARAVTARWRDAAWRPRAVTAAVWGGALAAVAPALPEHLANAPVLSAAEEGALGWLAAWPPRPGREGVLASWPYGHLVQYYADRPVVATPFGTEGGAGAMEEVAAFWTATEEADAQAVLERRRCGLVLLGGAVPDAILAARLRGMESPLPETRTLLGGRTLQDTDRFWALVATRLYYEDGVATGGGPAVTGLRLVFETPATSPESPPNERRWKLFEVVDGARVEVTGAGGAVVRATIPLATPAGRSFEWAAEGPVEPDGRARFRLPYASGSNGAVRGGAWTISDGRGAVRLVLHEAQVTGGAEIAVDLGADQASAPGRAASARSSSRSSAPASSAKSAR